MTPEPVADADLLEEGSSAETIEQGRFGRVIFLIGSAGLLVAAASDAVAVLGRHVGFRLLGSIEIVQFAVVVVASAALVTATLLQAHAAVHLLTSRLAPRTAAKLARGASLLSAITLIAMAVGSLWIIADLWNGFERTELLKLPLYPFRIIWLGAILTAAALFVGQAVRRAKA
jgi:TRAP-type transport system small permease protein